MLIGAYETTDDAIAIMNAMNTIRNVTNSIFPVLTGQTSFSFANESVEPSLDDIQKLNLQISNGAKDLSKNTKVGLNYTQCLIMMYRYNGISKPLLAEEFKETMAIVRKIAENKVDSSEKFKTFAETINKKSEERQEEIKTLFSEDCKQHGLTDKQIEAVLTRLAMKDYVTV